MKTTELIDMSGSKGMSEQDVEAFLAKLKQAGGSTQRTKPTRKLTCYFLDTDKKVDILQLFGLKVEDAGHVRFATTPDRADGVPLSYLKPALML